MSSDSTICFTKDNLDTYLKELAKEFRKLNGNSMPAEIILIGGAAILANYGFRDMTTDVDAVIHASSSMKDAINRVGDRFNLPHGWLNTDFTRTSSYSPKLDEVSGYYKTFSNVLQIRAISAEYLIAMKLRSGRKYKNDMSDVIGILAEHEKRGTPITQEKIDTALQTLYGGWVDIPTDARAFITDALRNGRYEEVYASIREEEKRSRDILVGFERDYPGVTKEANVDDILAMLKAKKSPVLEKLREAEQGTEIKHAPKKKRNEPER
jgi:hypothetical protein